jgi:hypothetical protein
LAEVASISIYNFFKAAITRKLSLENGVKVNEKEKEN